MKFFQGRILRLHIRLNENYLFNLVSIYTLCIDIYTPNGSRVEEKRELFHAAALYNRNISIRQILIFPKDIDEKQSLWYNRYKQERIYKEGK